MGVFIGLDVSLSKTAVCVVDRDGVVLWQGKVASEPGPLVARLAEWSGSSISPVLRPVRCRNGCTVGFARRASQSCVSRFAMLGGSCLRARSRPTEMMPAALPR